MKLTRNKASGYYQVSFRGIDGKRHTRSTKAFLLEEAKAIVARSKVTELEMAAKANALNAESLSAIMAGRSIRAGEAISLWAAWRRDVAAPNTIHTQEVVLRQWLGKFDSHGWPVPRLTHAHIDRFVNDSGPTKRSTRDMRLAAIRSFFKFCSAKGYCVGNPADLVVVRLNKLSHVQREPISRVPFTEDEYLLIMANASGFHKRATALSYWTGLRLNDIACLEWPSILPHKLVVWTRKAQARVMLPLDDPTFGDGELRAILLEMMQAKTHPTFCFPEQRDISLDPTRRAKLSVYYSRLLKGLGIKGKSFHCLRHSFATRLENSGMPIKEIGRLIGHASNETTRNYIHASSGTIDSTHADTRCHVGCDADPNSEISRSRLNIEASSSDVGANIPLSENADRLSRLLTHSLFPEAQSRPREPSISTHPSATGGAGRRSGDRSRSFSR